MSNARTPQEFPPLETFICLKGKERVSWILRIRIVNLRCFGQKGYERLDTMTDTMREEVFIKVVRVSK